MDSYGEIIYICQVYALVVVHSLLNNLSLQEVGLRRMMMIADGPMGAENLAIDPPGTGREYQRAKLSVFSYKNMLPCPPRLRICLQTACWRKTIITIA